MLADQELDDEQRRAIPMRAGTSHGVFVCDLGSTEFGVVIGMRFFTTEGELPACGHGTVAALALIADQVGGDEHRITVKAGSRLFEGQATRHGRLLDATFDAGIVAVRQPTAAELGPVLASLRLASHPQPTTHAASVGRERLLVRVPDRDRVATVAPDFDALKDACDRSGLLGCYVYSPPDRSGRMAARMFAPSIRVSEDIANANSTACVAAVLAREGITKIAVDMGDSLDTPATVIASARSSDPGSAIFVGGSAAIVGS